MKNMKNETAVMFKEHTKAQGMLYQVEAFLGENFEFRRNILNGKTEYRLLTESVEPLKWHCLTKEAVNTLVREAKKNGIGGDKSPRKDIEDILSSGKLCKAFLIFNALLSVVLCFWGPSKWFLIITIPMIMDMVIFDEASLKDHDDILQICRWVLLLMVLPITGWIIYNWRYALGIAVVIILCMFLISLHSKIQYKLEHSLFIIVGNASMYLFVPDSFFMTLMVSIPLIINVLIKNYPKSKYNYLNK